MTHDLWFNPPPRHQARLRLASGNDASHIHVRYSLRMGFNFNKDTWKTYNLRLCNSMYAWGIFLYSLANILPYELHVHLYVNMIETICQYET